MKRICAVALVVLLSSCAAHPQRDVAPAQSASGAGFTALPPAGIYHIDASQSELRVLVYRAGSLAHLGHNHVLVNHDLTGNVLVGATLASSSFDVSVPVHEFSVDDAEARREEGADFPGEVPAEAKTGTLRNMLSASQLNAAQFATLVVKSTLLIESTGLDHAPGASTATLAVNVAGRDSVVTAPFSLQTNSGRLSATASFELRQTALGLTPYSLLGGALQVKDALLIKIKIIAAAQ